MPDTERGGECGINESLVGVSVSPIREPSCGQGRPRDGGGHYGPVMT